MHRDCLNEERWERNYNELKIYLEGHPECTISTIPEDYRTRHHILLARWVYEQHKAYYGNGENNTPPEKQRDLMKQIGIEQYRSVSDKLWFERLEELKKYYNTYHTLKISTDYLCSDGTLLIYWTRTQRRKYHDKTLKKKYIHALEESGFMEILETNEEKGLRYAMQYYHEFHNLNIPCAYICADGYRLGLWIRMMRERKQKLSKKTRDQLDEIGMIWSVPETNWLMIFQDCEQYFKEKGHLNMPYKYVGNSGFHLRQWLNQNRTAYKNGKLSQEKIEKLNRIGALTDCV